jgi:hypothetical protein
MASSMARVPPHAASCPCPDDIHTTEAKVILPEAQTGSSRHNSRIIADTCSQEEAAIQFRKLGYLQRLSLLQDFTPAELLIVAGIMDLQTLERHDQVLQIGEPTVHVYVVLEGRVKI